MSILYFVHLIWTSSGQWLSICEVQYINSNSIIWEVIVQYSITVHFWRIFVFSVHFRFSKFSSLVSLMTLTLVVQQGNLHFGGKACYAYFTLCSCFDGIWSWSSMNELKYQVINYLDLGHMPYFYLSWHALYRSRGRQGSIVLVDLFLFISLFL